MYKSMGSEKLLFGYNFTVLQGNHAIMVTSKPKSQKMTLV